MSQIGQKWLEIVGNGQKLIKMDRNEQKRMEMAKIGQIQPKMTKNAEKKRDNPETQQPRELITPKINNPET